MSRDRWFACLGCEGYGFVILSCCGDDMKMYLPDSDLCPTCGEHQGSPEKETCGECKGTGRDDD